MHMHFALLSNAGIIHTFPCPPGFQGAFITGTQGIGVSAPHAAAVAEATLGLAIDLHMPKGAMLSIGAKSIILAIGILPHMGRIPTTVKVDGAIPIEH